MTAGPTGLHQTTHTSIHTHVPQVVTDASHTYIKWQPPIAYIKSQCKRYFLTHTHTHTHTFTTPCWLPSKKFLLRSYLESTVNFFFLFQGWPTGEKSMGTRVGMEHVPERLMSNCPQVTHINIPTCGVFIKSQSAWLHLENHKTQYNSLSQNTTCRDIYVDVTCGQLDMSRSWTRSIPTLVPILFSPVGHPYIIWNFFYVSHFPHKTVTGQRLCMGSERADQ